jgi:hypothetical protein
MLVLLTTWQVTYTLQVSGGMKGSDLTDGFVFHDGKNFTTIDKDNDLISTMNCANSYQGGWW